MAALVQSFPAPTSSLTMLQSRSPTAEAFQAGPSSQQHQRSSPMPRNIYNASVGGMAAGNYRGHTVVAPVAPYAFTSTPVLPNAANPLRQHPTSPLLRHENRTSSAPSIPLTQHFVTPDPQNQSRQRPPASSSIYSSLDLSTVVPFPPKSGSKDDNAISMSNAKQNMGRPLSAIDLNSPSLSNGSSPSEAAKPLPERYRRNHRRTEKNGPPSVNNFTPGGSAPPSGSGMATVGHLYTNPLQSSSTPSLTSYPAFRGSQPSHAASEIAAPPRFSSLDDMNLPKQSMAEQAKRYRRKSVGTLDVRDHSSPETNLHMPFHPTTLAAPSPSVVIPERKDTSIPPPLQPPSSQSRRDSNESSNSSRSASRPSSVSNHLLPVWCPHASDLARFYLGVRIFADRECAVEARSIPGECYRSYRPPSYAYRSA